MTARLRVLHVIVQPVLVWDDGDEMAPGPEVPAQALSLSKVGAMLDGLPAEIEAFMAAQDTPTE